MVKIAVAGGSGSVASEIIDALVATKKHEILLLSRKDAPPPEKAVPGVTWVKANYEDVEQLVQVLQGVDTVLSVIVVHMDPGNVAQRNLIDAAVRAGVRRFAPSEWALSSTEYMPWYSGKAEISQYLKDLNKDKKVLEYTLFQPGLFVNYLTYPYQSAKHLPVVHTPLDLNKRRVLIVEGSDDVRVTFTRVEDLANVVARAVEYKGEWPVVGGIKGTELTVRQLIELGEKIRGGPFNVEKLRAEDLKAGVYKASWSPKLEHSSFPPENAEALSQTFTKGLLLGMSVGGWNVSDEWNRMLPDYQFIQAEDFLTDAWRGKP
ncbi:NAD(P)-binding protein [Achaetomium macrosporum]|uniref:NAD(P)-binding protein n=1 Tax=Achaetomium macrosporum TaxID=79813 RepID=A0AAN7C9A0_9PEZI|nr:NAD(P)-binding protein [Achaetomium macrosporum]